MAAQRIRIRLKAYDHRILDQSTREIVDTAKRTGATVAGPIPLPTVINRWTVLRSPHVDKKSREQFEVRTHKRLVDIVCSATGLVILSPLLSGTALAIKLTSRGPILFRQQRCGIALSLGLRIVGQMGEIVGRRRVGLDGVLARVGEVPNVETPGAETGPAAGVADELAVPDVDQVQRPAGPRRSRPAVGDQVLDRRARHRSQHARLRADTQRRFRHASRQRPGRRHSWCTWP